MNGSLGIGDLTHGVSASGAADYVSGINTGAIENAIRAVQDTSSVKTALQQGWQGAAEANFEKNLDKGVNVVCDTLRKVEEQIESLVSDLVEDVAQQDAALVEEADIISF